jgi:hypothetical protein
MQVYDGAAYTIQLGLQNRLSVKDVLSTIKVR